MNVVKAKDAARAASAIAVAIDDECYPPLLRAIPDPPPLLYVRGDPAVLLEAHLAVVGSRRASPAGLRVAQALSGQLASAGLHICSGLALGIDSAAHRGALASGGKSAAVMATGIDRVYPQRHRALAAQLEQAGCLVTEFPPGTPPLRQNFPKRNRIISGLSLGVIVVEASHRSGALITARLANEQGREVFAVPGPIDSRMSRGCHQLIRDGAKLIESVDDVLEELGPLALPARLDSLTTIHKPAELTLGDQEKRILNAISPEGTSFDSLCVTTGLPAPRILSTISILEVRGLIKRLSGASFARI